MWFFWETKDKSNQEAELYVIFLSAPPPHKYMIRNCLKRVCVFYLLNLIGFVICLDPI